MFAKKFEHPKWQEDKLVDGIYIPTWMQGKPELSASVRTPEPKAHEVLSRTSFVSLLEKTGKKDERETLIQYHDDVIIELSTTHKAVGDPEVYSLLQSQDSIHQQPGYVEHKLQLPTAKLAIQPAKTRKADEGSGNAEYNFLHLIWEQI